MHCRTLQPSGPASSPVDAEAGDNFSVNADCKFTPAPQEAEYHVTNEVTDIYPDFVTIATGFGVPAKRVRHPSELRAAIREMLDTPGPYLLDVMVSNLRFSVGPSAACLCITCFLSCSAAAFSLAHSVQDARRHARTCTDAAFVVVQVPHIEHVLPMIPGGGSFNVNAAGVDSCCGVASKCSPTWSCLQACSEQCYLKCRT